MNAVERLWRAFAERDWTAARAQLHAHAQAELVLTGEVLDAADYLTAHRMAPGRDVRVLRTTTMQDDRPIAVHATVTGDDGVWHCAGFYELQQARISRVTELWALEGSVTVPDWRR